jgi:hypothetical protein
MALGITTPKAEVSFLFFYFRRISKPPTASNSKEAGSGMMVMLLNVSEPNLVTNLILNALLSSHRPDK